MNTEREPRNIPLAIFCKITAPIVWLVMLTIPAEKAEVQA